jgi:hypothetical protein
MTAEFINRPLSGEYEERHFGETSSNSSWVIFIDDECKEWVGSFAKNWEMNSNSILKLGERELVFIVACGQGYLIDAGMKAQINKDEIKGITSAICDHDTKKIYFSNSYDLKVLDEFGNIDVFYDRYFFDDIELIEIRENKLYARYWNYQASKIPYRFEIDLDSKKIVDSFYDQQNDLYSHKNPEPTLIQKIINTFRK